ncbi:MAG: DNA polymerase III subunit delta [Saprospiraceae bacterium]|nr:DNA polymerase III subunit delta [Saprospiraceae bacterium]
MPAATFDTIMKDLQAGKFAPVYLLHGEETYFIDQIADVITEHALSDSERVFNLMVCYGKETDSRTITDNARQYPMMSQRRVIILKEAQSMRDLSNLEPYLAHPAESTVLVICHMHKKLDGRKSLYKTANQHGVVFESRRLYDNKVPAWIESFVAQHNKQIEPVASMALVEYLGNDLSKVANELEKLMLQLGDQSLITEGDVFDNIGISRDFNVFELQKAIGKRDIIRIERIVQHFMANMKSSPLILVVANLFSYFSRVLIARSMSGASDRELGTALGLRSNYFLREYREAARNYSIADLEHIITILRKYDLHSKGVDNRSRGDDELLRQLIQEIYLVSSVRV